MSILSRRNFIATTSLSLAGTVFATRRMFAQPASVIRLSADVFRSGRAADAFFPAALPAKTLQELAANAIDAARHAGASYADVRVAEQHTLFVSLQFGVPAVSMHTTFAYGVRVIVDGAWAFAHGEIPSADAVTTAAIRAVNGARGYAPLMTERVDRVSTPAVTGEWATPITVDPFTIPFENQAALLNAFGEAAQRVNHSGGGEASFNWRRETRVFASSEGGLTTQTFWRAEPKFDVMSWFGMGGVRLTLPHFSAMSGGYETVVGAERQEQITELAEEAARFAALPRRKLDVGRYPVIFDGRTCGIALSLFFGSGLEADRALGYDGDAAGPTVLSPPETLLGTVMTSPALTVTAHRGLPTANAVKWDDEGVVTSAYPVVQRGTLVNYHTSRQTAAALNTLGAAKNAATATHSTGCAYAPEADHPVLIRAPHLVMEPSSSRATLDDLCKAMGRGILVRDGTYFQSDPQFASGELPCGTPFTGVVLEIDKGKIVRRIEGNNLQYTARPFWNSLVAVGDRGTVYDATTETDKGYPWRSVIQTTSAPAALFKEANVIVNKYYLPRH